jgi:hypothetical protein
VIQATPQALPFAWRQAQDCGSHAVVNHVHVHDGHGRASGKSTNPAGLVPLWYPNCDQPLSLNSMLIAPSTPIEPRSRWSQQVKMLGLIHCTFEDRQSDHRLRLDTAEKEVVALIRVADDLAQAALFHPELKTHVQPFSLARALPNSGHSLSLEARQFTAMANRLRNPAALASLAPQANGDAP